MGTLAENKGVVAAAKAQEETRLAWLALAMSPGLGPKRIADAIRQVETPFDILSLPLTALEGLRLPGDAAHFIFDGKARAAAEAELKRAAEEDASIVTPNTLIKQGAKLVATWEDVWEDLPSQVRLELDDTGGCESGAGVTASLLPDPV